jgi:tetratricopeptide (TPR) repeat protein
MLFRLTEHLSWAGRRRPENALDYVPGPAACEGLLGRLCWAGPCWACLDIAALGRCQYRRLRHRDSTADLGRICADLVAADPALAAAERCRSGVPRQLPADVSVFTGRTEELAELDRLLASIEQADRSGQDGERPTAVVISAVSGTAGVGKTALALRWAHHVRDRFPDGQLYVNLRGYDPDQAMAPAEALARFLTGLGLSGQELPLDLDERAARYRTEIAGRRLLVVLDNASSVEQVRPLLPGTASAMVVVTSRDSLAGLVALHGAHRLDLDLLPLPEAVALLGTLIGPRTDAEPDAAAALAEQCARLPLALRVAAELAFSRPATPLADLVAELGDLQQRLERLDAGGDPRAAVQAVFSWSYRHLSPEAAGAFRLLGLHPGPDLDPQAAAALTDVNPHYARRMLDLLARAHLLQTTSNGRYGMHDLLHAYATGQATLEDTADQRRAAVDRLLDYYLASAAAAMDALHPAEAHLRPRITPASTPDHDLADPGTARTWLDAERPTLAAVAAYTAEHDRPAYTVRLAATLYRYLAGGHPTDALTIHGHAHRAAQRSGDPAGQAQALTGLGTAYFRLGQYESAADHHQRAYDLYRKAEDRAGEARALTNLGTVHDRQGRYQPAADHHRQALDLHRQTGERHGEAHALNNLGVVEWRLGHYDSATKHYRQALDLHRHAGDRSGEGYALTGLGMVEQRLGQHQQAAGYHQQALLRFREIGNLAGEADVLDNLGTVHTSLGHPDRAADYHRQALALARACGDRNLQGWALNGLGEAAQAADNSTDALTWHARALTIASDIGSRGQQARAHAGLGRAYSALADHPRARQHYEHAFTIYTALGQPEADGIRARLALAALNHTPSSTTVGSADRRDDHTPTQ